MKITFHDDARRELRMARDLVVSERGLDVEVAFLLAVKSAMHVIGNYPLRAPPAPGHVEVRQFRLNRLPRVTFPWRILYRVLETEVRVLAVEHLAARPDTWSYRR